MRDRASRMPPRERRAMAAETPASALIFSLSKTPSRWPDISSSESVDNCKIWQRERMVSGSLWSSVVAKRNLTLGGGSSRVLSRALKAGFESMCTSSMR